MPKQHIKMIEIHSNSSPKDLSESISASVSDSFNFKGPSFNSVYNVAISVSEDSTPKTGDKTFEFGLIALCLFIITCLSPVVLLMAALVKYLFGE